MSGVHPTQDRESGMATSAAVLDEATTEPLDPLSEAELRLAIEAAASRILALIPGMGEERYPEEI